MGSRGSAFEELINRQNELYLDRDVAYVQKIATPVRVLETQKRGTFKGVFTQSTVDYVGVFRGRGIAFDAKETKKPSLPLSSIKPHQIDFLKRFDACGGIAFFLVSFVQEFEFFAIPIREYLYFVSGSTRQSIPIRYFRERAYRVNCKPFVDYLEGVKEFLNDKATLQ